MSTPGRFRSLYLSHFSTPASDRPIYRTIFRLQPRRILEVGLGCGERSLRMVEAAARFHGRGEIRFTGVDLFESRTSADGPGMSLKLAHRRLAATGAKVLLVPGDPYSALARAANTIGQVDLMVFSSRLDPGSLAACWFYVPRMLRPETAVFLVENSSGDRGVCRLVDHTEIESWARPATRRRAA